MYRYAKACHSRNAKSLTKRLEVSADKLKELEKAQSAVRIAIRTAFRSISSHKYDSVKHIEILRRFSVNPEFAALFRPQGSSVYGTLNERYDYTVQRLDYDDGLFLPVFIDPDDDLKSLLPEHVFPFLDRIISDLCKVSSWKPANKQTCLRVVLDGEKQVDCAVYAIRRYRYATQDGNDYLFSEQSYQQRKSGMTYLAHRSNGWIMSDPRRLERWFKDAKKKHGAILVRLCRYLKAWRDANWFKGGPSSIALMAAAVHSLRSAPLSVSRDDEALKQITHGMQAYFGTGIPNPVVASEPFDKYWKSDQRSEYCQILSDFHEVLRESLSDEMDDELDVVNCVEPLFGSNRRLHEGLVEKAA